MTVRTTSALLLCATLLAPRASFAQPPTSSKDVAQPDDAKSRALKHFERARELYRDGNYPDALTELEAAQRLDPEAKDLVYNLALVSEKLGRFDDALRWMRRYTELDLDAQERTRAESAIRRLEGAKRTLAESKRDEQPPPPPPTPTSPKMGRIDAFTIGTGALAIVGLGVGTIFAIDALGTKPKRGFVTGQQGSYAQLADQAADAHEKAIVADVGFGVFIASGAACALLYFLRPKDQGTKAFVTPTQGGAAIGLSGALP